MFRYRSAHGSTIQAPRRPPASPISVRRGGDGNLFFLICTISVLQLQNGDVLGQATRTITVKQGTALFFPLINVEWDNVLSSPHLGGFVLGRPMGVPELEA